MSVRGILDVLLGVIGLGIFIYGDLVTSRALRMTGAIVITVCVVVAAIMAAFRQDEH